jgi:hypothetical protein
MVNLKLPPLDIALELMQIKLKPGQEMKLCLVYLDCCFEHSIIYNTVFGNIIQVNIKFKNISILLNITLIFVILYLLLYTV